MEIRATVSKIKLLAKKIRKTNTEKNLNLGFRNFTQGRGYRELLPK